MIDIFTLVNIWGIVILVALSILTLLLFVLGAFFNASGLIILHAQVTGNDLWLKIEATDFYGDAHKVAPILLFVGSLLILAGLAVGVRS